MTKSRTKSLLLRARWSRAIAVAAVVLLPATAPGQQPTAPGQAVASGVREFNTIEYRIRVTRIVEGLRNPYAIAFLPGGDMLVTQMNGEIRLIRGGRLMPQPVGEVPGLFVNETGAVPTFAGLMDVALHPQFTQNRLVYYSYIKPGQGGTMALGRATFDGSRFSNYTELLATNATGPQGNLFNRIAIAPDATVYFAVSHHNNDQAAQDLNSHGGKVLRLRDDGSPMTANPFAGQADKRPEVFTSGHRGIHGLTVHPQTGQVWIAEHGDELNVAKPGGNYGWPFFGVMGEGGGTPTPPAPRGLHVIGPYVSWNPAINLSGLMFYTGDRFPRWKGNAFLGGGRHQQIHRLALPMSGPVNPEEPLFTQTRETLFTQIGARVRDVREGPDGLLYFVTIGDSADLPGAIWRIEPAGRPN